MGVPIYDAIDGMDYLTTQNNKDCVVANRLGNPFIRRPSHSLKGVSTPESYYNKYGFGCLTNSSNVMSFDLLHILTGGDYSSTGMDELVEVTE